MKLRIKDVADFKRLCAQLELLPSQPAPTVYPAIACWASGQYEKPEVEFVYLSDYGMIFTGERRITIDEIARVVVEVTGDDIEEVKGPSRKMNLMDSRCIIAFEAKRHGYSYPQIGAYLNRHHSTMINVVERYADYMAYQATFQELANLCAKSVSDFIV